MRILLIALALQALVALQGCTDVWNDPYPASERGKNIFYSAFIERPKHLDPVQSYTEDESHFTREGHSEAAKFVYGELAPVLAR